MLCLMFTVKINEANLKQIYKALADLEKEAKRQSELIARDNSFLYSEHLKSNIATQAFDFIPLNEEYAAYKAKHGLAPGFWRASYDLFNSIGNFRIKSKMFGGGIRPASFSSYNHREVNRYARANEFGHGPRPPRPLFGNTTELFVKGPFKTRGRAALESVAAQWR